MLNFVNRFVILFLLSVMYNGKITANSNCGLLWEISGNGLNNPSYLLGTYHTMSFSFIDSISGVFDVFKSIKQVVLEINILLEKHSIEESYLQLNTTYYNLLNLNEIHFLDSVCISYGLPKISSSKTPPSPLFLHYILNMCELKKESQELANNNTLMIDTDIFNGMDYKIAEMATANSLPIIGLETNEDKMIFPPSNDIQTQAKMLVNYLKNKITNPFAKLIKEAYYNQDLKMLELINNEYYNSLDNDYKEYLCRLDIARNSLWMEKIPSLIQNKSSLIAVGALHLPGKHGLITLLRNKGYTVIPL